MEYEVRKVSWTVSAIQISVSSLIKACDSLLLFSFVCLFVNAFRYLCVYALIG